MERKRSTDGTLIIAASAAAAQVTWSAVAPIVPELGRTFGVSATAIGVLVAVFGVGRMVANIPSGILAAHLDRVALFRWSMIVVVITSFFCGIVDNFTLLLVLRAGTGLAAGAVMTTGLSLLADSAPPGQLGKTMSRLQAFQLAGGAAAPSLGGVVAASMGVRAPFWFSGALALVAVLVGLGRLESPEPAVDDHSPASGDVGVERRRGLTLISIVGYAIFYCRFAGMYYLIPLIAVETVGLSLSGLGLLFGAVALGNVGSVVYAGAWSDRFGRRPLIITSLFGVSMALGSLTLVEGSAPFVGAVLALGLLTGAGASIPLAFVADVTRGPRRSRAIGVYRTAGDFGGVTGPVLSGLLVDNFGMHTALIALAIVPLFAGTGFLLLARETTGPHAGRVSGSTATKIAIIAIVGAFLTYTWWRG